MAKQYTKGTWTDEVLVGDPRYDIKTDAGSPINEDVQIVLNNDVVEAGTAADEPKMSNIEDGIDALDTQVNQDGVAIVAAGAEVLGELAVTEGGDDSTPAAGKVALYAKADGLLYSKDDAGVETQVSGGASGVGGNLLTNPNFNIWQRGTTFTAATLPANSDDNYLADQWILLSDGNDIVDVSRQSISPPEGSRYFLQSDVQTANKKFGFLQLLRAGNSIPLQGKSVSLSIRAKSTAAAIRNIRAAIISWDGTADTVTSDVVSAWGAEGANITPVANWTLENTPANLALTTSWQTFTIENVALDTAGIKNIGVFIWVDDADAAVNDILDIGWVKLEIGAAATDFIPPDTKVDESACQKSLVYIGNTGSLLLIPFIGQRAITTLIDVHMLTPSFIWSAPVLLSSSPAFNGGSPTGNQISFYDNSAGNWATISGTAALSLYATSTQGVLFRLTASTSFSGTAGVIGNVYFGSTCWIALSAEL